MAITASQVRSLSDSDLYRCFVDRRVWDELTMDGRIAAANELEKRTAMAESRKTRTVSAQVEKDTPGSVTFGGYYPPPNDCIRLNSHFFDGTMKDEMWSPLVLMDTILHEGRHAYQMDKSMEWAQRMVKGDPAAAKDQETGRWYVDQAAYLSMGETGAAPYMWQPIEMDARHFAGLRLRDICRKLHAEGKLDFNDISFNRSLRYLQEERKQAIDVARIAFRNRITASFCTHFVKKKWAKVSKRLDPRLKQYCDNLTKDYYEHINVLLDGMDYDYMDGLLDITTGGRVTLKSYKD